MHERSLETSVTQMPVLGKHCLLKQAGLAEGGHSLGVPSKHSPVLSSQLLGMQSDPEKQFERPFPHTPPLQNSPLVHAMPSSHNVPFANSVV
jgi:hypothetical protein